MMMLLIQLRTTHSQSVGRSLSIIIVQTKLLTPQPIRIHSCTVHLDNKTQLDTNSYVFTNAASDCVAMMRLYRTVLSLQPAVNGTAKNRTLNTLRHSTVSAQSSACQRAGRLWLGGEYVHTEKEAESAVCTFCLPVWQRLK